MQKKEVVYDALDEYNPFSEVQSQPSVVKDVTNYGGTTENSKDALLNKSLGMNNFRGDKVEENEKESTKLIKGSVSNWSPFPECCPLHPCFYIDLKDDIPEQHKKILKFAYYLWIAYSVAMSFNILGSLAYYLTAGTIISGSTFGTSIIFGILFPILSFFLWFKPLYKAIRWDSSANYFLFFIIMCGQIIITAIQMMGIDWLGSCGFINALIMLRIDILTGCIMFFIALWFCGLFTLFLLLLFKINYIYRHSNISNVQNAKSEISTTIIGGSSSYQRN